MHSDATIQKALKMYRERTDLTTGEIADKFGIWPSTLTNWATSAGIKLRDRGPRRRTEPSARHKKILDMAQVCGATEIGRRMGMSKQQVHRIIRRWDGYKPDLHVPFKPGDYVRRGTRKFRVITAEQTQGVVEDDRGRKIIGFRWLSRGTWCQKVAANGAARRTR